mmetsp:Transcript_44697/g.107830  ORF Transcript_44697/g.107830 Transcript_44697/m.107830 type:complete len:161 (-) Transcript_44697:996-1478(-)
MDIRYVAGTFIACLGDFLLFNFSVCSLYPPHTFVQIGNKRLKVQHKQIRSAEQPHDRQGGHHGGGGGYNNHMGGNHGGGGGGGGNHGGRGYMPSSLPPSGPMAMSAAGGGGGGWYQSGAGNIETAASKDVVNETEDGTGPSSFATMDPLRQSLPEVDGTN